MALPGHKPGVLGGCLLRTRAHFPVPWHLLPLVDQGQKRRFQRQHALKLARRGEVQNAAMQPWRQHSQWISHSRGSLLPGPAADVADVTLVLLDVLLVIQMSSSTKLAEEVLGGASILQLAHQGADCLVGGVLGCYFLQHLLNKRGIPSHQCRVASLVTYRHT